MHFCNGFSLLPFHFNSTSVVCEKIHEISEQFCWQQRDDNHHHHRDESRKIFHLYIKAIYWWNNKDLPSSSHTTISSICKTDTSLFQLNPNSILHVYLRFGVLLSANFALQWISRDWNSRALEVELSSITSPQNTQSNQRPKQMQSTNCTFFSIVSLIWNLQFFS